MDITATFVWKPLQVAQRLPDRASSGVAAARVFPLAVAA